MLACLLGEGYLLLMTFVVHWYGDLPEQAAWYLARTHGAWRWLAIVRHGARRRRAWTGASVCRGPPVARALRVVAGVLLGGILVENIWLVAPRCGTRRPGGPLLAGLLAILACGGLAASRREAARFGVRTAMPKGAQAMGAELTSEPHEAPSVRVSRVLALVLGFVAFAVLLGGGLGLYYRWIVSGEKLTSTASRVPGASAAAQSDAGLGDLSQRPSRDPRAAAAGRIRPGASSMCPSSAPRRS